MTTPLFRPQVVRSQGQRLWGEPLATKSLPGRTLSTLLALFCTLVVIFLCMHQYQRKISVAGVLLPRAGLIELKAPAAARITDVQVATGQQVVAGQALLTLVFEAAGNERDSTALRLNLEQQLDELQGELQLRIRRGEANRRRLLQQQADLQQRLRLGASLVEQGQELLQLAERNAAAATALYARALLAASDLAQRQAETLQQRSALAHLRLEQLQTTTQLRDIEHQLPLEQLEDQAAQATLRQRHAELQRQLLLLARERSRVISAPVAGTVGSLALRNGMSVLPASPLLSLLPAHNELVAALDVPSRAVGFIASGQQVGLRLDAFPYQKFGPLAGRVLRVDGNAALASDGAPPRFQILVQLQRQSVAAYGAEHRLLAGMSLQADVLLERRSLWEWLFEPLYGLRGR